MTGKGVNLGSKKLKIYEAPGTLPNIPCIRLQGKWLSNLGFHSGNPIKVTYSNQQLIIETIENDDVSNHAM